MPSVSQMVESTIARFFMRVSVPVLIAAIGWFSVDTLQTIRNDILRITNESRETARQFADAFAASAQERAQLNTRITVIENKDREQDRRLDDNDKRWGRIERLRSVP